MEVSNKFVPYRVSSVDSFDIPWELLKSLKRVLDNKISKRNTVEILMMNYRTSQQNQLPRQFKNNFMQ